MFLDGVYSDDGESVTFHPLGRLSTAGVEGNHGTSAAFAASSTHSDSEWEMKRDKTMTRSTERCSTRLPTRYSAWNWSSVRSGRELPLVRGS